MNEALRRLWRLFDLVEKEDIHLRGVTARLFEIRDQAISPKLLETMLSTPEGIDRLESFVGKFSRMQDTVMDKLLPALLTAAGDTTGTALDNLNRAQRLGFVDDPDAWLGMRQLRNRLVHEYVDDLEELAAALSVARTFTATLSAVHEALRRYAERELPRPSA